MTQFEDLPDELKFQIFSFLNIKDLLKFAKVSKRTRMIYHDELLWEKIDLSDKIVKAELIEEILDRGCKFINLRSAIIKGQFKKNLHHISYKVKYLNLTNCRAEDEVLKQLIASCKSVQMLSLQNLDVCGSKRVCWLV